MTTHNVTIVPTIAVARHHGARGANGLERMPDGSLAIPHRTMYERLRGLSVDKVTVLEGVVLDEEDREVLAVCQLHLEL